ncbi:MAG: S41 family peptidase [Lewinellaceae bacterium]|nr:S41 family peptidase [Lewinellaceae bacterium]
MRKLTIIFLAFLAPGLFRPAASAQGTLSAEEQSITIDSLIRSLEENYVFPELAKEMGEHLLRKNKAGAFKELTEPVAFADRLTEEIQSISKDKHLRVRFDPEGAAHMRADSERGEEEEPEPPQEWLKQMARSNYGFQEVKILEGNVGYLDLRGFMPAAYAGETATAAMNMLSNTDAIIFDLRQNGGGDPGMIQLLTSYLYDSGRSVHLNSFYFRQTNDTSQTWTLPYIPGKRNPDAEVFVLTSSYTFSAAEEFTYNLKNLERATIVGETTGGGAHPGGTMPIADRFVAFIPLGRAINPITNTNWEGTGVSPHVDVEKEKALDVAHQLALEKLAEKAETEEDQRYYEWIGAYLKAKNEPAALSKAQMEACAGNYGARNLIVEDGELVYQRTGRPRMELIALSPTTFALKDDPELRFTLEMENGEATALILESISGWKERTERSRAQP